jgi:uncharacterized protein (TIGR00255 family)
VVANGACNKRRAKKFFTRGKFNIAITTVSKNIASEIFVSAQSIQTALKNLENLCVENCVNFAPTDSTILELNNMLQAKNIAQRGDWEIAWELIAPVFANACKKLDDMRSVEGEALKTDLTSRIAIVEDFVQKAQELAKVSPEKYRDQLFQKLSSMGLEIDLTDDRLLKEVCIFADRCDVSEEITRLKSHIKQFLQTMNSTEAVGRKLDFICQEMNREINTIGSKNQFLEVGQAVIEAKDALENIREQAKNVE